MRFPELAAFDSDSVKHGLDALKIHVADVNAQRVPPFATVGEYLADVVARDVAGHVQSRITYQQLQIITPELAKATDVQLQQIGAILGKDLTIEVPDAATPVLARLGITSTREDLVPQPVVETPSMWDRMKGWFNE